MKVEIDQLKCTTVGICVQRCPDVFRFQEGSKKAAVTLDVIPPALQAKVTEIAALCPNQAIIIKA